KQQLRDEPSQSNDIAEIDWHPVTNLGIKCRECTKEPNWGKRVFKPSAPAEMRNVDISLDHKQFTSWNQYEIIITNSTVTSFTDTLARTFLSIITVKFTITTATAIPEQWIRQASFNRQRDNWATKSYLLKYIGKPNAGLRQQYIRQIFVTTWT
ncbi:MAG: hypothetical protein EZS28_033284, partial [Streblomastix strix]